MVTRSVKMKKWVMTRRMRKMTRRVRQTLAKVRRSSEEAALVAEHPEVVLLLILTGHPAPETPPLSEAP